MTIPKPLLEALKELLRVVLIALIPVIILQIQDAQIDAEALVVVAVIAGLRFVDKFLHEIGKERNSEKLIKGLTRF